MQILYSVAGSSDPISREHDGGILHTIRHYKPEKAVIVLTKDMKVREDEYQVFTKAIASITSQCEVILVPTDIERPHIVDELRIIVDTFYQMKETYPEAQFLINLTSATPQIQVVLSYLSLEDTNSIGIQIDTPDKNIYKRPFEDHKIDEWIKTNKDSLSATKKRCHEPRLHYLRNHQLRKELWGYIESYRYDLALERIKAYKKDIPKDLPEYIFSAEFEQILKHCEDRRGLKYQSAIDRISSIDGVSLTTDISDVRVRDLWEYFMVLELRRNAKLYDEMMLRMTPYMCELVKYYMKVAFNVDWNRVIGSRGKVDRIQLNKTYPFLEKYIASKHKKRQDPWHNASGDFNLSLYYMKDLIENRTSIDFLRQPNISPQVMSYLNRVREVEASIRNVVAHELDSVHRKNERDIEKVKNALDIMKILFKLLFRDYKVPDKNIYDVINGILKEKIAK